MSTPLETVGELKHALNAFPDNMQLRVNPKGSRYAVLMGVGDDLSEYIREGVPFCVLHLVYPTRDQDQ